MHLGISTISSLNDHEKVLQAMSFPENLIGLRKAQHLTQQALAEKAGISVLQIKNYEHGRSQPTLESIKKLAAVFAVTADALIFSDDERDIVDDDLRAKLNQIEQLCTKDRETVLSLIDAYIKKARLEQMMHE
jgi:transcriptional regulator with XRE-family HTH domain